MRPLRIYRLGVEIDGFCTPVKNLWHMVACYCHALQPVAKDGHSGTKISCRPHLVMPIEDHAEAKAHKPVFAHVPERQTVQGSAPLHGLRLARLQLARLRAFSFVLRQRNV